MAPGGAMDMMSSIKMGNSGIFPLLTEMTMGKDPGDVLACPPRRDITPVSSPAMIAVDGDILPVEVGGFALAPRTMTGSNVEDEVK